MKLLKWHLQWRSIPIVGKQIWIKNGPPNVDSLTRITMIASRAIVLSIAAITIQFTYVTSSSFEMAIYFCVFQVVCCRLQSFFAAMLSSDVEIATKWISACSNIDGLQRCGGNLDSGGAALRFQSISTFSIWRDGDHSRAISVIYFFLSLWLFSGETLFQLLEFEGW